MKDLIIKEVDFQGNKIISTIIDSKVYISVKNVCDNLGMDETQRRNQRAKVQKDELLKGGLKFTPLITKGGVQETLMIELDYLPIWLAKINPARFDKELKEKLMIYQLKAKDVLSDAFFGKRANNFKPIEVDKKPDWLINRVRTRLDQAEYLENQIAYLFEKLNEIYSKAEIELETKTKQVTSNFWDFKTPSDYDPAKEKLPVLYEVEIEKENLEEMEKLGINKDDALNDIVENKTLENTVKILGQQKLTTKE